MNSKLAHFHFKVRRFEDKPKLSVIQVNIKPFYLSYSYSKNYANESSTDTLESFKKPIGDINRDRCFYR